MNGSPLSITPLVLLVLAVCVALAGALLGAWLTRRTTPSHTTAQAWQALLAGVLHSSRTGLWELHLDEGRIRFHGHFYTDLGLDTTGAGLSLAEWRNRCHPEDRRRLDALLAPEAGHDAPLDMEFRVQTPQGDWHWLQAQGQVVTRTPQGQALGWMGVHLDITSRRQAQEAQELSRAQFESFFQVLPDAAGISRVRDGLYLEINQAFEHVLGYSRTELVGKTSQDVGIWATPAERQRLLATFSAHGEVIGLEMRARHKDGRVVPGRMSARIAQVGGEDCFIFLFHDLSDQQRMDQALRQANALLRDAGRMARLGGWQISYDGQPHHWSDVCREIHGLGPEDPIPENYIQVFVVPEFQDALATCLRRCRHALLSWDLQLQIRRTDGQKIWVRFKGEPVVQDGQVVRLVGIAQDIDESRRQVDRLRESEEQLQRIFQLVPDALGLIRQDSGHHRYVNPAWEQLTGWQAADAAHQSPQALGVISAADRDHLTALLRQQGQIDSYEVNIHHRHRPAPITCLLSLRAMDMQGQACWLFVMRDISERKQAEALLREREEQLSLALDAGALGLWDWDIGAQTVRGDRRWLALHGWPADTPHVNFMDWQATLHPDDLPQVLREIEHHLRDPNHAYVVERRVVQGDGRTTWIRDMGKVVARDGQGRPTRMVGINMDITTQHEQQRLLEHIAHSDPLTGLPNRFMLADRLHQAMSQVDRQGGLLAVAYLDLDGFKPVNDQHGHAAGDSLLVALAHRLSTVLRASDTVARLGGDEFVMLLTGLSDELACEQALHRVMEAIAAPYTVGNCSVQITASIGATLYPQDNQDADTLLRHADQAMYAAKQAGRNRFQWFDTAQDHAWHERHRLRQRVQAGLVAGELCLYYQPKTDLRSGAVVGAEALVRWQHPEHGLLTPDRFLHAVEDSDLDVPFGRWVMQTALAQAQTWHDQGQSLAISVNITGRHLQSPDFCAQVLGLLDRHPQLPRGLLELEILESAALQDVESIDALVRPLRERGVRIALDDFGTGYSSLTYLRKLPIDVLKIDRSFVRDMRVDPDDRAIVEAVIGLATAFGLTVIAEGVETVELGCELIRLGCSQGQGYGIARPMPAEQLPAWLQAWQVPVEWQSLTHSH